MASESLFSGKFLDLKKQGTWEYAERANAGACVGVLALTEDEHILLVEQFRIPVQQNVIEIPAGLFGDEVEFADESIADCANRELIEETGYSAKTISHLLTTPTSAGLSNEVVHLFLARDLEKVGEGGGVDSEDITVHKVPLNELLTWCKAQEQRGCLIDSKIFSCLFLAQVKTVL